MVNPGSYHASKRTTLVTFGGEARSGKGTSVAALTDRLRANNKSVERIDQGLKFRTMAEYAIGMRQPLDDETATREFFAAKGTKKGVLKLLGEVAKMDDAERKDLLYRPIISAASAEVGRVPQSHSIAVGLLREEVRAAAEDQMDFAIIDGRAMEKYGQKFSDEGIANYAMGWYFRCDAAIAARRSLGMLADYAAMNTDERLQLLTEVLRISDRNRADAMREVDPMVEPEGAYRVELATYGQAGHDTPYAAGHHALRHKMATVNTSYTRSVEEMTYPVTDITMHALLHLGAVSHESVGIQTRGETTF